MANIRFGSFDFDPAARELRRDGTLVRLQPQPAHVLAILLSRPGEVITREELRAGLWGADTFVDFDRGLNFCIAQIRSALGDASESPLYIRTIPRRGYQFIAPTASTPVSPAEPVVVAPQSRRLLWLGLAALVSLGALSLVWSMTRSPERLAVALFDNQTGDRAFDDFARQLTDATVMELAEAGKNQYAVIGNAAILRTSRKQRDLLAIHASLDTRLILLCVLQKKAGEVQILAQLIGLPSQAHLRVNRIPVREGQPTQELARMIWDRLRLTDPPKQ